MKYFCLLAVLWLGLIGSACAQPTAEVGQQERAIERSRISAERQKLDADFKAAEVVCFGKFFANSCRDQLLPPYRERLADLRRQEILISDAERKINAADQLLKTEEKLKLQQQQQIDQALKVQQNAATQAERLKQRETDQGNSALQAESNKANTGSRLDSNQGKAGEALTKRAQATANVEATHKRQEQAAKNRAEREQRLQKEGLSTGKSLPAFP
jgi:colicin import membrane protein